MASTAFAIINKETLKIVNIYHDEAPKPHLYGDTWGNLESFSHVPIPDIFNPYEVACTFNDEKYEFYIDDMLSQELYRRDRDNLLHTVRFKRNQLLQESDWTVSVIDSPLTATKQQEWIDYRRTLRDITSTLEQINSIDDVTWPTKPN